MCLKNHNLIIVFDGVCNLCNKAVDFVIKRDKKELFLFCPLQSKAGQQLSLHYNIPAETDSVILIFNNKIFTESEAALKIARLLPFPWKITVVFWVIPKKIRDKFYSWIARNRYHWFGKKPTCRIPAAGEYARFITEFEI